MIFAGRVFWKNWGITERKKEKIAKAVFKNPLWQQFDLGLLGDENIIAQMKKESPAKWKPLTESGIRKTSTVFAVRCHTHEKLLRSLHERGYKMYILSNYGQTLLESERKEFTFLRYMSGAVFSWEVNQIKPNAEIYDTLIRKYNLDPQDMVFFDDLKANCDGARQAGITAVEVNGVSSILEGLKKYCGIELPELAEAKDR